MTVLVSVEFVVRCGPENSPEIGLEVLKRCSIGVLHIVRSKHVREEHAEGLLIRFFNDCFYSLIRGRRLGAESPFARVIQKEVDPYRGAVVLCPRADRMEVVELVDVYQWKALQSVPENLLLASFQAIERAQISCALWQDFFRLLENGLGQLVGSLSSELIGIGGIVNILYVANGCLNL